MGETSYVIHYRDDALKLFRALKRRSEKTLAQVSDDAFFSTLGPESNSIAVIVKHIAGNLRSRWTNFLTTDGDKPDRHRDTEFELTPADTRESLMARWESGWQTLFNEVGALTESDFARTVMIREEPHTIIEAINRQLSHYSEHVGQIILLARHAAGDKWQTLSIPRGQSEQFNAKIRERLRAKQGDAR